MRFLGTIVHLQVQRSSLKLGERPSRWYDPSPLLALPSLLVGEAGVVGLSDDGPIVDVHHAEHPRSKNRGENGVSVGFTAHYRAMRQRFGAHLPDGIAGENVLVETDDRVSELDLTHGLLIETSDGSTVFLDQLVVAEPCVEFSRYALGDPDAPPDDPRLREALTFLRNGTRGFYATYGGTPVRIAVGDRVLIP
jgi:hypothetical protein